MEEGKKKKENMTSSRKLNLFQECKKKREKKKKMEML